MSIDENAIRKLLDDAGIEHSGQTLADRVKLLIARDRNHARLVVEHVRQRKAAEYALAQAEEALGRATISLEYWHKQAMTAAHAGLVEALEPFARFYAEATSPERGHGGRDTDVFYKLNDVAITLGDLRRAAEALAAARGGEGS